MHEIESYVSRETIDDLTIYRDLITRWNPSINLVAKSTLSDVWGRHILDSLQLFRFCTPTTGELVDLGSGGGLPGIVLATCFKHERPSIKTTLVESDQRKATFLRSAIRELNLNAEVLVQRIESIEVRNPEIISSRALASLSELFTLSERHSSPNTTHICMKGRKHAAEIAEARLHWDFNVVMHQSMTDKEAKILEVRGLKRAKI